MSLLIGSRALSCWFPGLRKPKDWDIITDQDTVFDWAQRMRRDLVRLTPNARGTKFQGKLKDGSRFEFELVEKVPSSARLLEYHRANERDPQYKTGVPGFEEVLIASPRSLTLLKRSHLHIPLRGWFKHIEDYHYLRSRGVGNFTPEEEEILALRKLEVDDRSRANLAASNEDFFAKSEAKVQRIYEHDDLHLATCFNERPLFELCKEDLSQAMLLERKFRELPENLKFDLVREEAYAIALERFIVPRLGSSEPEDFRDVVSLIEERDAYRNALRMLGTTLTKGWFREFLLEEWPKIYPLKRSYISAFQRAILSGKIRRRAS